MFSGQSKPNLKTREEARSYYERNIPATLESIRRGDFCTHDQGYLVRFMKFNQRWIDCAPEGAGFILAPLQDFAGVPCGPATDMNVGPNEALRNARAKRGLCPFSGRPLEAVAA